jgi:hypothetical protein
MLSSDRQAILDELQRGRQALGDAISGVDERQAVVQPAPGRWTIVECIEHLTRAEQYMLTRLQEAYRSDQSHDNRPREAMILSRGADRTRPMESPEMGKPDGRFHSLGEALAAFDAARVQTIRYVEAFEEDPRRWITGHPLIPGPVNCYEMLLIIAVHPARHAKQIAEIRAGLA